MWYVGLEKYTAILSHVNMKSRKNEIVVSHNLSQIPALIMKLVSCGVFLVFY